jgi:hypothetical protein
MKNNPRTHFTTPKGTELQLLNLKGKEYLQVAQRLVWFREERPNWGIQTEIVERTSTHAICRAQIVNESGLVVSCGTKHEEKTHFSDFLEKAETGAIGRALAHCGYGTAFSGDELDEGERIVDSPIQPLRLVNEGEYLFDLGNATAVVAYKGKPLSQIPIGFIEDQKRFWETKHLDQGSKPAEFLKYATTYIERYHVEHTE